MHHLKEVVRSLPLESLGLEVTASWSPSSGPGAHHRVPLRAPEGAGHGESLLLSGTCSALHLVLEENGFSQYTLVGKCVIFIVFSVRYWLFSGLPDAE